MPLNSPLNDHAAIGFARDNNRVAGFGPGAGAMCIGNNNWEGGSAFITGTKNHRTALGTIGWGVSNEKLDQGLYRRTLAAVDMPHKKAYDFGGLKDIPQMETTGLPATHVDTWLGIPYESLEEMSVREQRVIVKQRVTELR